MFVYKFMGENASFMLISSRGIAVIFKVD
jgi:hypothetical protein